MREKGAGHLDDRVDHEVKRISSGLADEG